MYKALCDWLKLLPYDILNPDWLLSFEHYDVTKAEQSNGSEVYHELNRRHEI